MTRKEALKYQLYAQTNEHKFRVQQAEKIVRAAIATAARPYVACSFGKDSLCLAHLVAMARPGIDVIWVRADEYDEWPDTARVAAEFGRRWPISLHEIWTMSVTECYRRAGRFYIAPNNDLERRLDAEYSRAFLAAIGQKAGELSCDLALIGLRKDESRGRRILLASRGNTFYARGNQIVQCYPLANWTAADVWSYILKHDLPYPSLYDLAENRETARNGAMFAAPTLGHYRGQMAALKRMYPALFNKFAADFPEVSAYV